MNGRSGQDVAPSVCAPHAAVLGALAEGVAVEWGLSTTSVDRQADGGVRVSLSDGSEEVADLVVAADGVHSVVRPAVTNAPPRPSAMANVSWRFGSTTPGSTAGPPALAGGLRAGWVSFDERWVRFDEAVSAMRALWDVNGAPFVGRFYDTTGVALAPPPAQPKGPRIWIGSWGSDAGLRRVARLGDGWLASGYNTTPEDFAKTAGVLDGMLEAVGRDASAFPSTLATSWMYLTDDATKEREVVARLSRMLRRSEEEVAHRLPVGSVARCVDLLGRYQAAGLQRVLLWPVDDELDQIERFASDVIPKCAVWTDPEAAGRSVRAALDRGPSDPSRRRPSPLHWNGRRVRRVGVESRAGGRVMTKVLVVYGSRHGGTRGIAERIGEVLQTEGLVAEVVSADQDPDLGGADGIVVGSGVYMGSWLKEPLAFLERNVTALATRPLWLFSSGPLLGSTAKKTEGGPLRTPWVHGWSRQWRTEEGRGDQRSDAPA